jgi:hypothetical protein
MLIITLRNNANAAERANVGNDNAISTEYDLDDTMFEDMI